MLKIITLMLLGYAGLCLFMFLQQRNMMYFPTAENRAELTEVLWLQSGGERLKIWKLNGGDPAIIYFGGNAEAVEYNIDDFQHLMSDYTVYLVNYRGYGGSSGKPTEQGLFEDALNLYDLIAAQHSAISVIGRSLGSGVAVHLAAQRDIDRLVLITPYDSMVNLAQSIYPIFPVRWLLHDRYDSLAHAQSITSRTQMLIAESDRIVPRKHSINLATALQHTQPEISVITGTDHNSISVSIDYRRRLAAFLALER